MVFSLVFVFAFTFDDAVYGRVGSTYAVELCSVGLRTLGLSLVVFRGSIALLPWFSFASAFVRVFMSYAPLVFRPFFLAISRNW